VIDRETWVLLAERCAEIRRLCEPVVLEDVVLVYDSFDQAHVIRREA
jgi:hypothetical protein